MNNNIGIKHGNNLNNSSNLVDIQNEVNNTVRNNFIVDKYLGKGKYYDTYRGINNDKSYIIKVIDKNDTANVNLIIAELGFLKLLNKYKTSKKYINPCYDFGISQNKIFAIFKALEGDNLKKIISSIGDNINDITDKYNIIKVIIKNLLASLQYIHKKGISHQNIHENNIIFNFNKSNNEVKVELHLVNFGLSCGNYIDLKGNDILHLTCSKLSNIVSSNANDNITSKDVVKYINNLPKNISSRSKYFHLSKKKDIQDLGLVFMKLMKTLDKNNKNIIKQYPKIGKLYEFVVNHMLTDIENRYDAQRLLQEFILSEKYDWE